ncbi:hypothetical protein L7F22_066242 [Adiantum nelumboides]|nr:hypothetical protein [Adiantum nelumboides]
MVRRKQKESNNNSSNNSRMRQRILNRTIGILKPLGPMVLLDPQGGLQKELNEEPRGLSGVGEGKQIKVIHQGDQGEMSQQGLMTDTRAGKEQNRRILTLILVLMEVTNLGGGCILEDQAEEEGNEKENDTRGKKHDDPDVHIQAFEQYAELKHIEEGEWGEYFPHTLKEAARKWYYHYSASKLQSYRKLKKAFILEYTDDRGDEDILCELDRIKQGKLSVRKYVQKIKELTRRLNEPPSEKRMRALFLSGFNSKKLREQEVPTPTKKFTELVHRALKLEQQAKKEKHRHKASSSDSSSSDSSEAEKTSANSSESEEDKKKKKKDSWSKKIDEMSKRISEINGLRGSSGRTEKWCTKCQSKNHTSDGCTQCTYYKAFGHEWPNCKIRIHHLKEDKDLAMITYASMETVPVGNEQQNIATASGYNGSTSGYNGWGRGRGRGSTGDFKRNFNCYKCGKYGHFAAQCPEPYKQVAPEVKQPEPVPIRAVTRSTVVIEELPNDPPAQSKLNPKAKEWSQQRSTWKEKGKAKEYDEWQEHRELAAKITEL